MAYVVKLKDYKRLLKNPDYDWKTNNIDDGSVQYCIRNMTGDGMKLLGFISLK